MNKQQRRERKRYRLAVKKAKEQALQKAEEIKVYYEKVIQRESRKKRKCCQMCLDNTQVWIDFTAPLLNVFCNINPHGHCKYCYKECYQISRLEPW